MTGIRETVEVIADYGFQKAIHAEELVALMPELSPRPYKHLPESLMLERKAAVLKRFNMGSEELISQL